MVKVPIGAVFGLQSAYAGSQQHSDLGVQANTRPVGTAQHCSLNMRLGVSCPGLHSAAVLSAASWWGGIVVCLWWCISQLVLHVYFGSVAP